MKEYRILDVCDVYQPKTVSTKEFVPDGKYIVYGANGAIGKYDKYNHEGTEVLMACRGATCGAINVSKPYSWINGNAMVIHPNGNVPINFLYLKYCLEACDKSKIITGTAQPQITRANLKYFTIPLCSISEQGRIVARIEELFSELDKAVETLQTTKKQLAVYRQAVLKEAFDGLSKSINMDDIATMIDPHPSHRTPPKVAGGIPYVGIGDFDYTTKKINFPDARKVSKNVLAEHLERYTLRDGDFVMGKIGTIGKPFRVILPQNYTLSANVILIQPDQDKILPSFLYWQFTSDHVVKQLMKGSTATSQPAFGIQKARLLQIKFCDIKEQHTIVEQIESRLSVCDSIENTVDTAFTQTEAMRQSILKEAFEGRL